MSTYRIRILLVMLALIVGASTANADTITFVTPTTEGQTVSASVTGETVISFKFDSTGGYNLRNATLLQKDGTGVFSPLGTPVATFDVKNDPVTGLYDHTEVRFPNGFTSTNFKVQIKYYIMTDPFTPVYSYSYSVPFDIEEEGKP